MAVIINRVTYQGKSVSICNGKVIVDGKKINIDDKIINIKIDADIDKLEVDYCEKIEVNGNVGDIKTTSGDVKISKSVFDNVKTTSGDIKIGGDINGSVQTVSGDVEAKDIYGSVKTISGDIDAEKQYM